MSTLTLPPGQLPSVGDAGAVYANAGKYARNMVLTVVDMMGGAPGLYAWANENAQNKADFWTKLFPKVIQKEVEINDRRSIEDVLQIIDGEYEVVEKPRSAESVAQFASFDTFGADLVVGALDDVGELVDD